jgi:CheY-like chemotaxis protein
MTTEAGFLKQVKDALHHLYDYAYLENHPLALRYWPELEQPGPNQAQRLHRLLLETIEALHPPTELAKNSSRAEYYFLLVYRYVEERALPEILQELGYSRRQFFRQQQKAIEMLAALLWEKTPPPATTPVRVDNSLLDDEFERFLTRRRAIDPVEVVQGVLEIVNQLAKTHQVALSCDLESHLPIIYGSRTLLRQVFLKALSHLITQAESQRVHLRLYRQEPNIGVELTAEFGGMGVKPHQQRSELSAVRHLVEMIGGHWQGIELTPARCRCQFDIPAGAEKVLLVVEDNEAVIQAFRRYLTGYSYQVIGTTTGAEALRLAGEMTPSAITLDVMIPDQDGWEILQALKHNPATQAIPVIICSVLEDPELARSLGAAAYLRKPVAQADLLATLDRMGRPS